MQINRAELEKALAVVKPGLAAKDIVEQSTSFAFLGKSVVTYNDEISLSCPIKGMEIEGAIEAEQLFQFLRKVKKEEIDIEVDGEEILFKSGRIRAGFTLQTEILLPLKEVSKRKKWLDVPDDFCHYLSLAMGAAGNDMSEPLLTGVNVAKDGGMMGSDNYKVMICDTGQELPIDTFLIPATSAVEVIKIKPTKMAQSGGWVHFQNEEKAILSCRVFAEPYPNADKKLEVIGIDLQFPSTINETLDRASVFAKRGYMLDESVDISIAKNRIKVKAKSDTSWIEEELNLKYSGDPINFTITPYLLRDILHETQSFVLGERALQFKGAGWTYITALRDS